MIDIGNKLISQYSNQEELQAAYTKWFRDNKAYLWPLDRYKYIDKTGVYTGSQSVHNPGKEGYRYDVIHPKTKKPCKEPLMGYRFPEETMKKLLEEGKVLFGEDESKIIELKVYASEYQEKLASVLDLDGRLGAYDIKRLFPELKKAFTNPKPVRLLSHFIPFILKKADDIILDFFAGSCTTAHAVLDLNKEDGGNRKFIMVQLPEPCDEKSEAFKAGYKTIADIGKERIRRVIKKIAAQPQINSDEHGYEQDDLFNQNKENLSSSESIRGSKQDLGFKVLKLHRSNFEPWEKLDADASEEEISMAIQQHLFHIDPEASQEDILYEILLKAGFMPTEKIEKLVLSDGKLKPQINTEPQINTDTHGYKKDDNRTKENLSSSESICGSKIVYSIAGGALLICLEDEITRELIDAVAEAEPMQFICLDQGFKGNDQLKTNAVQTFAARNQGQDKAHQIVFRTV